MLMARRGLNIEDGSELFDDWTLHQPRAARLAFALVERAEWKTLPEVGGWFEQDELLMEDLTLLSRQASYVRAQVEADHPDGE
jgi:hypothetical protein